MYKERQRSLVMDWNTYELDCNWRMYDLKKIFEKEHSDERDFDGRCSIKSEVTFKRTNGNSSSNSLFQRRYDRDGTVRFQLGCDEDFAN